MNLLCLNIELTGGLKMDSDSVEEKLVVNTGNKGPKSILQFYAVLKI